jgi:hypothetical protein
MAWYKAKAFILKCKGVFSMTNLLPLGSIVLLQNGEKKIMIYGRKQIEAKTQKVYDYVACLNPEGNINEEYCYLFNHEDIKEIIFRGYSDVDEETYLSYLETLTEQAGNTEN